jgi:LysR family glycine cleavage system transcriptional activator
MQSLASKLPPLKSLVAFEAVSRHLSLTRAGEELRISREAVSRHIRVLEEHLGVKLFDRLHRAVALTPPGKKLQRVVRESLENIAYVSGSVCRPRLPFKITVSATIAISSFWLTPRLARFRSRYPNIEIHVAISDAQRDLYADDIDVGLRYGDGNWPGLTAIKLFDVRSFPVCSPAYLEKAARIEDPADLLNHTLINLDGTTHATEDWWWWLNEQNVRIPASFRMLGLDSYDNVVQLALKGEGVALGYSGLVTEFLDDGRLVRPIDASLTRNRAVYLVTPATTPPSPKVQNFIDWIVEEAPKIETEKN